MSKGVLVTGLAKEGQKGKRDTGQPQFVGTIKIDEALIISSLGVKLGNG